MKVKLLKLIRGDIRIKPFSFGFYDLEMYYNFKWRKHGSHYYMSDMLSDIHYIMNYRLGQRYFIVYLSTKFKRIGINRKFK